MFEHFLSWYADHYILGTIIVLVGAQVTVGVAQSLAVLFRGR